MRIEYENGWPHWEAWALEDDGRMIREFKGRWGWAWIKAFIWGLAHWRSKRSRRVKSCHG